MAAPPHPKGSATLLSAGITDVSTSKRKLSDRLGRQCQGECVGPRDYSLEVHVFFCFIYPGENLVKHLN